MGPSRRCRWKSSLRASWATSHFALVIVAVASGGCEPGSHQANVPPHTLPLPSEPPSLEVIRPSRSPALPAQASAVIDRLATSFPESAPSLLAQGRILESYGQTDEAVWCWQRCLALDSQSAAAHLQLGLVALDEGRFETAVDHLRQSFALAPQSLEAATQLSQALLSLGRSTEAIEVLEPQLSSGQGWPEGWFQLGQAYSQSANQNRAGECFQAALRLDPNFRPAWYGLSLVHARLGDPDQARDCREKFLELQQSQTAPELDRWRMATDQQREAIALSNSLSLAAEVYDLHGRSAEAQSLWRQAADLDDGKIDFRLALGKSLMQAGQPREAIAVYEELLEKGDRSLQIPLLITLSTLHQRMRETAPARKCLQQALALDSGNPLVLSELVTLDLETNSHLAEAQELAERLVRLRPSDENFLVFVRVCAANRDPQRAQALRAELFRQPSLDHGIPSSVNDSP